MQMFIISCSHGFKKNLSAETKDHAVAVLCEDLEVQAHLKAHHPEFDNKQEKEMTELLSQFVVPVM